MPTAYGRSPLGYLQRLRALVLVLPVLALLSLTVTGKRPSTGTYINPASETELSPLLVPLVTITVLAMAAVRLAVRPDSAMALRYTAICVVYLLALASSLAGLVYTLAGGTMAWALFGYALAVAAVGCVPLGRYARDVSPRN